MSNRRWIVKDDKIMDIEEYLEEMSLRPFYTVVDHRQRIIQLIPINKDKEISKTKLRELIKDYQKKRIEYWKYEVKWEGKYEKNKQNN